MPEKRQPKIIQISATYDPTYEGPMVLGLGVDGLPYRWRGTHGQPINGKWQAIPGRWEPLA